MFDILMHTTKIKYSHQKGINDDDTTYRLFIRANISNGRMSYRSLCALIWRASKHAICVALLLGDDSQRNSRDIHFETPFYLTNGKA